MTITDKIPPIHPGEVAKYFGTSAELWVNLQSSYELDLAEDVAGAQIASITPLKVV